MRLKSSSAAAISHVREPQYSAPPLSNFGWKICARFALLNQKGFSGLQEQTRSTPFAPLTPVRMTGLVCIFWKRLYGLQEQDRAFRSALIDSVDLPAALLALCNA